MENAKKHLYYWKDFNDFTNKINIPREKFEEKE